MYSRRDKRALLRERREVGRPNEKDVDTGSIDGATSPSDSWRLDLIHDAVVLDMDGLMLEMTYVGIASRLEPLGNAFIQKRTLARAEREGVPGDSLCTRRKEKKKKKKGY